MKLLRVFKPWIVAFGVAASVSAGAAPIPTPGDWGTHDTFEAGGQVLAGGDFADVFLFTLADATTLYASAASTEIGPSFGIAGGKVSLYSDGAGPDVFIGSFDFSGATGSLVNTFAGLAAGSYYYLVSGTAAAAGGLYTLVSNVPEPQTYALLLAGLMMVLTLTRRRLRD
ncbi:FxDxF family PEP-CTERM protein [Caldimonas brevitalea]|uniref:PEP-CTERM protein-sorting domain-containing protein n=1 Tax=Caldimonas brevitalea TaxID=413882 RepID=A0A0G3BXK7_9BURK|nr:FxDxF family PEP-CTERM protein [Caldimonas brevitalea]AKJ32106.1 hypothetical protein AAW51_5415 [Caldimonas brevitalea]